MANLPGVYPAYKKDGTLYYRSSITYKGKHLSLGSYGTEQEAGRAYTDALKILSDDRPYDEKRDELWLVDEYMSKSHVLNFEKWIMLRNYKDNGMYCRNPIYLKKRYFIYFLDINSTLRFDADDLFYYMSHKIMKRGGHMFVADYGMQVNILSRYGIKNHAVKNRDYRFINGDDTDFRYHNIEIINRYYGVMKLIVKGRASYLVKIHINGDYIVGRYSTEVEAAIAYNKAVDILVSKGSSKNYQNNYIEGLKKDEYIKIYNDVKISRRIRHCTKIT